jgi:N-acetylglucosaminyl-diphospho-decaprenol L-rhamnosyltransferase
MIFVGRNQNFVNIDNEVCMISGTNTPVIIVGYRNPNDVAECLKALGASAVFPKFDVYICENGGSSAFDALVTTLRSADGPCSGSVPVNIPDRIPRFSRVSSLNLHNRRELVRIAEAEENLGYAGAINAWLGILLQVPSWPALWILNPDTQPDAHALAELVAWSRERRIGMVGSRIISPSQPQLVHSRGLRWRRLLASTKAVEYQAPAAIEPDPDAVEALIDAPSGASLYVTRSCLDRIGLMDERYFLYFEDLDWGYRAKKSCGVGYAHRSIVRHHGGTTIGSAPTRASSSPLSVYLEFRNRIHFVRKHHIAWLPWTFAVLLLRPLEYGMVGAFGNMVAAFRGVMAALFGEVGRPDAIMISCGHTVSDTDLVRASGRGILRGLRYRNRA